MYAQIIRSSGALRTHNENRTEVLCPRVTQAAMIAAASFGLRRSGTFATATSGAALGRISEAWPALAPPGECSLVHLPKLESYYKGRELSGLPSCQPILACRAQQ